MGSVISLLCDPGQLTALLCASVSSSIKKQVPTKLTIMWINELSKEMLNTVFNTLRHSTRAAVGFLSQVYLSCSEEEMQSNVVLESLPVLMVISEFLLLSGTKPLTWGCIIRQQIFLPR